MYVQRSHTSRCQVDDPDGVVVGVRNVEFPLGGSQPRRLIKLSDIACSIPETSLTGPRKGCDLALLWVQFQPLLLEVNGTA